MVKFFEGGKCGRERLRLGSAAGTFFKGITQIWRVCWFRRVCFQDKELRSTKECSMRFHAFPKDSPKHRKPSHISRSLGQAAEWELHLDVQQSATFGDSQLWAVNRSDVNLILEGPIILLKCLATSPNSKPGSLRAVLKTLTRIPSMLHRV